MNNHLNDRHLREEEQVLTFADIIHILRLNKGKILFGSMLVAALAFFYSITKPVEYLAEGSFREKAKSEAGMNKSILSSLIGDAPESDAETVMKSRRMMEAVIQKLNMQAVISKDEYNFPFLDLNTIKNNFITEYAILSRSKVPLHQEIEHDLMAKSIVYGGEVPFSLRAEITKSDGYTLYDGSGRELGKGKFGAPFIDAQFSFILEANPSKKIKGSTYHITLLPLKSTALAISKKFVVGQDKDDKAFIKIAYRNRDRKLAKQAVDALMDAYQEYTQNEHERISNSQVDYLVKRQMEMGNQLSTLMDAHADSLSKDLSSTGFATSEKAMEFIAGNQHAFRQKLLSIDLDIERLEKMNEAALDDYEKYNTSNASDVISRLTSEIQSLRQQADRLNLAIVTSKAHLNGKEPSDATDFQGINLATAKELYINYSKELNEVESLIIQNEFLISQIKEPSFEITSLSTVLHDPISNEMISKASNNILALKDAENRTPKELDRLQADLDIQKGFLTTHLAQSIELFGLKREFLKEKILALQQLNLSLVNEEISLIQTQIKRYISNTIESLNQEKKLLKEHLTELRTEMATFPQKVAREKLIEQQMNINRAMVEEITKLVETKNISSNLEKIQSTPLDHPMLPMHPVSAKIILLTIIGAILGAFMSTAYLLAQNVSRGIYASLETLKARGYHVSGNLSKRVLDQTLLDSDLTTCRTIIAKMQGSIHRMPLLIVENGISGLDRSVASLLVKSGKSCIVVDLCFNTPQEKNSTGMLQYLENEGISPTIQKINGIDTITSGGISRYSHELIGSKKCQDYLHLLAKDYDWVIAACSSKPANGEIDNLLTLFKNVVIVVDNETLDDLSHCLDKAKDDSCNVSLVKICSLEKI